MSSDISGPVFGHRAVGCSVCLVGPPGSCALVVRLDLEPSRRARRSPLHEAPAVAEVCA